jgi:CRP-like cAMP-binding protein
MSPQAKTHNKLLSNLKPATRRRLSPLLESFDLVFKHVIFEPKDKIDHVYFPESGIISLLSSVGDRATLEVGIVGNEGMVGLPLFLGEKRSDTLALVQGRGIALRMKAVDFLAECKQSDELPARLRSFTFSLMKQIAQSAACNRHHHVEARLARWLLMTHDRMRSNEFQITQEFLSNMIGVRREAVTKSAGLLQEQKLISYHRGDLTILDRKGLEAITCACYAIISA